MEFHTKTTVDDAGNKTTKIVGWSEKGLEYGIPWRNAIYLDIPDGYALPEDAKKDNYLGLSSIEKRADGTVVAEVWYGDANSMSSRGVTLEKINVQQQPKQQQPQKPAETKTPEKPKSDYDPNKATRKSLSELTEEKKTTTFVSMYGRQRKALNDIAKEKGWNWGKTTQEKQDFLTKKLQESYPTEKIDPNAINDVDNLMEMIRNCK